MLFDGKGCNEKALLLSDLDDDTAVGYAGQLHLKKMGLARRK